MKTILIIGGYGGFGGRLSRRLAGRGYRILVGGRSRQSAAAFCGKDERLRPLRIDRQGDVLATLLAERPDVLVDAAGPFQHSDYRVVEACIDSQIPYLDLADAREFVTGIGRYDEKARTAGVPIISGASSVPALSHAAVAALSDGLDLISSIEIAISASSRAVAGASVARAILGGVGQPIRVWVGRRWHRAFGWQSIRRQHFGLTNGKSLGSRLVALVDVPDLALLPQRYPDVSTVTFRAGTESHLANLMLWLASWPVRWRWLATLAGMANLLLPAQRLTALWGGDRSGMTVSLFGASRARRLERRWTLIAEEGHGPEIPVLAAELLADRIARGTVEPGARDAGGELSLGDFERQFADLAIQQECREIAQPAPLYARIMAADFDRLPPALREMHAVLRDHGAAGQAVVQRGSHPIARLVAKLMRFPPAGEHDLHVHFSEHEGVERWTRDFAGSTFSSRLHAKGNRVVERFGPLRFAFSLLAAKGGLAMDITGWSLGPVPLPKCLGPRSEAREWEEGGKFHFDVPIDLPLIGRVVRYRGWLDPAPDDARKVEFGGRSQV